tara:strand:- start:155 stop:295 length:141 start_codon:yes stop_codon:yes gene_type:complete
MNNSNDVELKVCKNCDAPLPLHPKKLSYFNYDDMVCDDCFSYLKKT